MSASKEWIPRLTLLGGALCLDFVNTTGLRLDPHGEEALRDYEDLVAWAKHAGGIDAAEARSLLRAARVEPERPRAAHRRAIECREAIFRIFSAIAGGRAAHSADIEVLNRALGEALGHLQLVSRDGNFNLDWCGAEGNLDLVLWRVARSAADLLVSSKLERVRECAGEKCDWLFLDASRNQSRHWCDMALCGNRAKARRNYARRKGAAKGESARSGTS